MTVVAHEFGHALGLGESSVSSSVMYGTYNGLKQALASDDIAGIQSIYGTRKFDQFNSGSQRDNTYMTATNINSWINSNDQIAIPNLDITTAGDSEWFYFSVPASSTGTMSITVQSSNLSSLSPEFQVYNSSLSLVGQASARTRWERRSASRPACNPAKGITSRFWRPAARGRSGTMVCWSISAHRLSRPLHRRTQSLLKSPTRAVLRSTAFRSIPLKAGRGFCRVSSR